MEYSAIIMQKLATYRDVLHIPPDVISPQDIELMNLLARDPDVQAWLERQLKEGG